MHFDDVSRRWLKFTKWNLAGYTIELFDGRLMMLPAKPLQYLERWRSYNRLFYDRVELVGLRSQGHDHQIVVSQKDRGEDNPTWAEIESAMVGDYQMRRIFTLKPSGGYGARAYTKDRFAIFDVRPVNCARSKEGIVVPFDSIPQILTWADATVLRRLSIPLP